MLVLYRTEVEDLFEYWVHRNKVLGFFWFLITISIHTVLCWLTLLDQQARSPPPPPLSFICKHKLIFVYLIASLD